PATRHGRPGGSIRRTGPGSGSRAEVEADMNCLECEARLQDQLDGRDLPDVEDAAVCVHLRTCTACRERHAAAQRLLKGLSLLAAPRPGAALTDRILAAVLQDQRKRRLLRRPVLLGLALAASLAAVALVGYFWP